MMRTTSKTPGVPTILTTILRTIPAMALAIALGAAGGTAFAASKIGVTAAAKNVVEGVQGTQVRDLATGSEVFARELIRTGAESVAQLLFLDQTTLSVGPHSEVVLDRFIYDPARGAGDVVLNATKGAFRFVSGSQNPASYKVETPVATIGFRGTIVDCVIGSLTCVVQEGSAVITVGGVDYVLEAGEALTVGNDGVVTGPYQHDGVFDAVNFGTPWPLYGGSLPNENWHFDVPDGSSIRIDDVTRPSPACYWVCDEVCYCIYPE